MIKIDGEGDQPGGNACEYLRINLGNLHLWRHHCIAFDATKIGLPLNCVSVKLLP